MSCFSWANIIGYTTSRSGDIEEVKEQDRQSQGQVEHISKVWNVRVGL